MMNNDGVEMEPFDVVFDSASLSLKILEGVINLCEANKDDSPELFELKRKIISYIRKSFEIHNANK